MEWTSVFTQTQTTTINPITCFPLPVLMLTGPFNLSTLDEHGLFCITVGIVYTVATMSVTILGLLQAMQSKLTNSATKRMVSVMKRKV